MCNLCQSTISVYPLSIYLSYYGATFSLLPFFITSNILVAVIIRQYSSFLISLCCFLFCLLLSYGIIGCFIFVIIYYLTFGTKCDRPTDQPANRPTNGHEMKNIDKKRGLQLRTLRRVRTKEKEPQRRHRTDRGSRRGGGRF